MAAQTFHDLASLRAFIDGGLIRLSQASRARIFSEKVIAATFVGVNGYGAECYDLISSDGVGSRWRVYLASFARETPRGHTWRLDTGPRPSA